MSTPVMLYISAYSTTHLPHLRPLWCTALQVTAPLAIPGPLLCCDGTAG